jgi:hypothetical protein
VCCLGVSALVLVWLGYPGQALQRSNDALALAQELAHPFSLAYTLNVVVWLHQFRRKTALTQERAEALLALCHEHGGKHPAGLGPGRAGTSSGGGGADV